MQSPSPTAVSLPVTQEELTVDRKVVDSGRPLRLRKEVEEYPAQVNEALTTESVHIERVPVGRVVEVAPAVRQDGDVTVVPVVEERLVIRKELVLVEEIRLTRHRQVRQMHSEVPLKRERVVAERFDPDSGQWRPEPATQEAPSQTHPTRSP